MPKTDTAKIPGPLYAAAGAGDIAIEGLRKLPAKVADLQDRAKAELPSRITVLQDKVTQKVAEIPSLFAEWRQRMVDADSDKLRESARRNAQVMLSNAQVAQEKAVALYTRLVTRGEQVVGRTMQPPRSPEKIVAEVVSTGTTNGRPAADTEILEAKAAPAKRATKARKTN
jgi:heparin binding hemagglutinin HbhA